MEQNTQNTSTKNDRIQILISSAKSPFYTLLTVNQKTLELFGISCPSVEGVYVYSKDRPSAPQLVWDRCFRKNLEHRIEMILSASIVNNEQKKAISGLISQAITQMEDDASSTLYHNMKDIESESKDISSVDGITIEQL